MIALVAKWGNSLALRIPATFAKQIAVDAGKQVDVVVTGSSLVVTPVNDSPNYDLASLVEAITDENRHDEVEASAAVGAEFS